MDVSLLSEFEAPISAMVNFLVANRGKFVQICLEDDKNLDLDKFDFIFHKIMENEIRTAFEASIRITTIILNILDVNKIAT